MTEGELKHLKKEVRWNFLFDETFIFIFSKKFSNDGNVHGRKYFFSIERSISMKSDETHFLDHFCLAFVNENK